MEPGSISAHRGTLEDPEVLQNVPGHVIPILQREFDDFKTEATKFLAGDIEEDEFIKFRLKQGVYGQRQEARQMIRVKLPLGGVNPDQLDAFADIAEQFTPLVKGHITTRQNIQYHHVPLDDAAKVIRILGRAGLSSREACGNTVRNVTGDPYAGVTDEVYDITPYGGAFVRYFVRNDVCQLLPRKFKVSFSANDDDRAISGIHDLGFLPRVRDGVNGVEIRTGGGTSIMPRVGTTLYDFVEVDNGDYLKVSEAVLRVFDRQEDLRANRQRARLKFMVDRVGIDAFREEVDQELEGDWVDERDFDPTPHLFIHDEEAHAPELVTAGYASPNGDSREFDRFVEANVTEQRQEGFSTVAVKVTRGDLTPEQFRGIAQIMRDFSGGYARTTVEQNIVLRWVRHEALYDVWLRLQELDLGDPGAHEITDVVSCPDRPGRAPAAAAKRRRAPRGDADRRQAHAQDPREDERLPERLRPAPHRQHRLLRGLHEDGRPPDARLRGAPGRAVRRRPGGDGPAPEGAAPGQAGARRRGALGAPLRARPGRRRGVQRLRGPRGQRDLRGGGQGPRASC